RGVSSRERKTGSRSRCGVPRFNAMPPTGGSSLEPEDAGDSRPSRIPRFCGIVSTSGFHDPPAGDPPRRVRAGKHGGDAVMASAPSPAVGRDASTRGPGVSFFRHPILYLNSRLDLKFIVLVVVLMATGSAVAIGIAGRQMASAVQDNLIQRATNVGTTLAGTAALLLEGVPPDRYGEALDALVPLARAAMAADPYIEYMA